MVSNDDDIEVLEVIPGETKKETPIEKVQENGDSEKSVTDNSEAPSTPVRASPRKNATSTPKVGELSAAEELKTPVTYIFRQSCLENVYSMFIP